MKTYTTGNYINLFEFYQFDIAILPGLVKQQ